MISRAWFYIWFPFLVWMFSGCASTCHVMRPVFDPGLKVHQYACEEWHPAFAWLQTSPTENFERDLLTK